MTKSELELNDKQPVRYEPGSVGSSAYHKHNANNVLLKLGLVPVAEVHCHIPAKAIKGKS